MGLSVWILVAFFHTAGVVHPVVLTKIPPFLSVQDCNNAKEGLIDIKLTQNATDLRRLNGIEDVTFACREVE